MSKWQINLLIKSEIQLITPKEGKLYNDSILDLVIICVQAHLIYFHIHLKLIILINRKCHGYVEILTLSTSLYPVIAERSIPP